MKKATLIILALLIVGVVAAGAVSAVSFGKFGGNKEAVRDAIEAKDFSAWKDAMVSGLTEERFNQMVERQENMPEWKGQMMQHNVEMQAAVEAGDFETWKSLMEQSPREELFELNEENFEKFVDMHNARMEGDVETAQALAEELGMPGGQGNGKMGFGKDRMRGEGRGMHEGFGDEGGCGGSCGGECPFAAKVTE